jgi:hypothetical protein
MCTTEMYVNIIDVGDIFNNDVFTMRITPGDDSTMVFSPETNEQWYFQQWCLAHHYEDDPRTTTTTRIGTGAVSASLQQEKRRREQDRTDAPDEKRRKSNVYGQVEGLH